MLSQVAGVELDQFSTRVFVARILGVEVGDERHLRIDHHRLASGQMDDEIGAQSPILALNGGLLHEVAVLDHAGHLDHTP